ncbi:MAG: PilZ domain-containing protein [Azonexus sp.]|nr:PilZ domain-containing protein [Azonexus sp.]
MNELNFNGLHMLTPERRRFPRFPFHSQGMLSFAGEQHSGTVLDVSLKGALFRAISPIDFMGGNRCYLEIFHAGQPFFCTATAHVAYHHESIVGLEFVELTKGAQQLLAQVMDMNLAVDSLLEREFPELLVHHIATCNAVI